MNGIRGIVLAAACIPLIASRGSGQESSDSSAHSRPDGWAYYASAYAYVLPDETDYLVPEITADLGALHLEARYNYEGLRAASLHGGWNVEKGGDVRFTATAMLGVVFGSSSGIAAGYRFTIDYDKFTLYSEGEYVFATVNPSENFFYNWSEMNYSFVDWFRGGLVVQRTRVYQTGLDLQRGLLAGFSFKEAEFTTYLFNPGWTTPTWVFAVAYGF